jgi:alcohol dehydrogenase class IV
MTNAILMPHVLDYNEEVIRPAMCALGGALGMTGNPAAAARDWLDDLSKRAEMPRSLGILGVTPAHIEELATIALDDICATTNPRPLDHNGLSQILRAAIGGGV